MRIAFTNTPALLLLTLIPLAIYVSQRGIGSLSSRRSKASLVSRIVLILLIVSALAGLQLKTNSRDVALMFLVDVSASVAQEDRAQVIDFINNESAKAAPRDYIGIIAFAREPSVELAPTRKDSLKDWRIAEISSNPPRDYTDIAAALKLAAALVPDDASGRFVLISDGNENLDSASEEGTILKTAGIEVYTHSIGTVTKQAQPRGEIAIRSIDVPDKLAEGEAFDVRVTIDSTRDTDATLRVLKNDSVVAEKGVSVVADGENVFVVSQRADQQGFYNFRAEVDAPGSDSFVQNNSREAFAIIEGQPRTLYLYGDARPSPAMLRVLAEGKFVSDIKGSAAVPRTLAGFQNYDLVIFDNVPASALTSEQMRMVQSYVRDLGGGFVMIGGDQSFGPGGYYKTAVEETLPVSLDVRQKKHLPSLALALVIDKSGSMEGLKIQLTHEAASAAADFLSDRDSLGVIAFDSEAYPIINLSNVDDKKAIRQKIDSIGASGGTNIYPALHMAHEWLKASDAQIKHIILLSDGRSESGDFQGIARSIRDSGETLSTVAVGDDADNSTMGMLASTGGGRFYQVDSPENLPRIFTREASLASRSTIIEEPFTPRLSRPTAATNGIDWGSPPQLDGYVATAERDSMKSPAIVSLISDKDDPVYAVWQYGLGRSAVFTSDAKPRWANKWMNWPGFGQFWTQLLRDVLRRESNGGLTPRVELTAGRGHVSIEATDSNGVFRNNLQLQAQIIGPDLSKNNIILDQTAPGQYEGDFNALVRGAYLVTISETNGSNQVTAGAVNSYSPEFNIVGTDETVLSRISEMTGGHSIADGESAELFAKRPTKTIPHAIWETLMLTALILLPIDIGIRRVLIDREQIAQMRKRIRSVVRRASSRRSENVASPSIAKLKDARSRVILISAERTTQAEISERTSPQTETMDVSPEPESSAEPLVSKLLDAKRKRRE
jgi:Ca-activated chloride channel homolog